MSEKNSESKTVERLIHILKDKNYINLQEFEELNNLLNERKDTVLKRHREMFKVRSDEKKFTFKKGD
ncbi:hypothetical protein QOZ98_000490 [Planomicrobium stackebrandtii]|uniref:Fur-regulated basic protein FbpA n=1 Tax=Planomicrobium stackebrandtii TaxID=253160 RepID=A0ABU0GQN3_9BACL|nr:hypothetical protein [Planomicrobium stackebrandtii]MDQ0427665.1 hypothetical protein [Planomicrobium stackebrandtii]